MIVEKEITVEGLCAWLMLVWGAVAFNPFSDLFPKNPGLFGPMAALVNSELIWGSVFMACGAAGLVLSHQGYTLWTARINVVVNTSVAILYAIGDIAQTGFWFFGSLALANFINQGVAGVTRWKMQP